MRDDGTTLSDDIHELYVYKVWALAVSHLPPSSEATFACASQLSGLPWVGQRIQGRALTGDSKFLSPPPRLPP